MIMLLAATLLSSAPRPESEKSWSSSFMSAVSGGGGGGWMIVEVVVDADGKPVGCRITNSHAGPAFQGRVCAVAMRTRYRPARDAGGNAVVGVLSYALGASLGPVEDRTRMAAATIDAVLTVGRVPADLKSLVSAFNLVVDPAGRVETCEVATSSGSPALDKAGCTYLQGSSFTPVTDAGGTPVRAFRAARVAFTASAAAR